ncbi:F0F1 ATP synthase subunit B [Segetibacter koreensis]|uniref:F0F1 ATP synthase subunit B n=1 Tax=Segetibacter koreensis TaxID=398037 RepID=UPI0003772216|nr:F0F1 ATP synthase subunit B [Segetibacter koreensis]
MELLLPGIGLIFWTLIAFIVVLVILRKFAWKPILSSLKERETSIASAIASAEKMKEEMALMKSQNEALLAEARDERAKMIKEAKDTTNKMISDAKDKARNEYDRIVSEAQVAIQQQKNAALTDVKNQVGKLVIEVSEKILRRELANRNEHENFIKQQAEIVTLN